MKITNTLDALLRLVLTTDEEEQVSEKASPGHDRKHRAQAADRVRSGSFRHGCVG